MPSKLPPSSPLARLSQFPAKRASFPLTQVFHRPVFRENRASSGTEPSQGWGGKAQISPLPFNDLQTNGRRRRIGGIKTSVRLKRKLERRSPEGATNSWNKRKNAFLLRFNFNLDSFGSKMTEDLWQSSWVPWGVLIQWASFITEARCVPRNLGFNKIWGQSLILSHRCFR